VLRLSSGSILAWGSSVMLVNFYQTIRCHIPQVDNFRRHRSEKLKFHSALLFERPLVRIWVEWLEIFARFAWIFQHLSTNGWNLKVGYTYHVIVNNHLFIPFEGKLYIVYGVPTGNVSEFSTFLLLFSGGPEIKYYLGASCPPRDFLWLTYILSKNVEQYLKLRGDYFLPNPLQFM
jgi:hypothetical protein